jgi:putative transposase
MSYNKKYNRAGALFLNPFRRVKVEDDQHFTQIVIYQHANVVKHGILKDLKAISGLLMVPCYLTNRRF